MGLRRNFINSVSVLASFVPRELLLTLTEGSIAFSIVIRANLILTLNFDSKIFSFIFSNFIV